MNSENIKPTNGHRLLLNLTDEIHLEVKKMLLYQTLSLNLVKYKVYIKFKVYIKYKVMQK